MPRIYLCFLWHMHQPFYKDLGTGEYRLPWTRLHALKDYYGMVRILEDFPTVRQTFNLVPSMMVQVKEYAAGTARDPLLELALRPAEELTEAEQELFVSSAFHANRQRMIARHRRYAELFDAWQAQKGRDGTRPYFPAQEVRDLQVLSQLAWFEEEFLEKDRDVVGLVTRGRNFSTADQQLVGVKQREILGRVLPAYARLLASGQIEISTTPYYHPILPLLCDSDVGAVSHPDLPLPPRFRHPEDARLQLEMARDFTEREFGAAPVGLWPSEGSVSDEALAIAGECGYRWAATDSGVLARTLGRAIGVDSIYRPYRWAKGGRELSVVFRDHFLSDLIGFVYQGMEAGAAAEDFLRRIRENCQPILAAGRDPLVPIILDGENAWEYYDHNGRPFLRELYRRIAEDRQMVATTMREALERLPAEPLDHIFPGSWINANFDVWIGAEEDNVAWTYLLRARETFDATAGVPEEKKRLAREELLIAEGSDWNWWYGPEHHSANRPDFDRLYRSHLANVYRFLGKTPPEELSRPILQVERAEFHLDPSAAIRPRIDGEVSSYFEWMGAGVYRVDERSGSMHGKQFLVREAYWGSDGASLFLRLDFRGSVEERASGLEARLSVEAGNPPRASSAVLKLDGKNAQAAEVRLAGAPEKGQPPLECALGRILEVRIPLAALGIPAGAPLRFQFSLWQDGLPVDAVPQYGWIELATTDPSVWSQ